MTKTIHRQVLGSGKPLVLLHGFAWDSRIWSLISQQLAHHYEVHLIDLPGFGKSSVITDDYSLAELGDILIKNTPLNAAWLGWSMGGVLAMWVAINYPRHLAKLVTVASSPRFLAGDNWPGIQPHVFQQFENSILNNYEQTIVDFLELQLRGSANSQSLFGEYKNQVITTPSPEMNVLKGGLKILEQDLRSDLNQIKCPILNIFGSHDTLVPVTVSQKILAYLPNSQCEIIKRSGHIPFLSQPEIFLKLTHDFLNH